MLPSIILTGLFEFACFLFDVSINQLNRLNQNGGTALMAAASNGHKAVVSLLLQDPRVHLDDADRFGNTVLMVAAQRGHVSIVKMLLQDKRLVNPDVTDQSGFVSSTNTPSNKPRPVFGPAFLSKICCPQLTHALIHDLLTC